MPIPDFSEADAHVLQTERIAELSKRGYRLLRENAPREAEACFSKILEVDKYNNYALVGLGDVSRKRGLHESAIGYYERCLDRYPGNNYALFGLADCLKSLNHFSRAIEIWERYLEHDEYNITVLTRVADAYRKLRDFKNSKLMYQRVLDIDEYNPYAVIGMGHLHYDFKEYRDALYYWERMLERRPPATADIRVLTAIGNCHRKLKAFDDGIAFFDTALQREPGNFHTLFGLADCFRGLNQPLRSLECWTRILKADPDNKVILTRAGDAYCTLRNFEMAGECYNRALGIGFDIYAILGLAVIDREEGRCEEAIRALRGLLSSDPKNYRIYLELAECYLRRDDRYGAMNILREFTRFGIKNTLILDKLERLEGGL